MGKNDQTMQTMQEQARVKKFLVLADLTCLDFGRNFSVI
jgi:hypothetical protein